MPFNPILHLSCKMKCLLVSNMYIAQSVFGSNCFIHLASSSIPAPEFTSGASLSGRWLYTRRWRWCLLKDPGIPRWKRASKCPNIYLQMCEKWFAIVPTLLSSPAPSIISTKFRLSYATENSSQDNFYFTHANKLTCIPRTQCLMWVKSWQGASNCACSLCCCRFIDL